MARRAFTSGASDYFLKDFRLQVDRERLVHSVRRAVEKRRVDESLQNERRMLESIIYRNPYSILNVDREGWPVRENGASQELWARKMPFTEYRERYNLDLDRVFDMSFTTDRRSHFGLGLSFVKKIVEAHRGTIEVHSEGAGKGAQFRLTLPGRRSAGRGEPTAIRPPSGEQVSSFHAASPGMTVTRGVAVKTR